MIPRVVAAEVHFAVADEVPVRPDPCPQHERDNPEEDGDVVPPCEQIGRGRVRFVQRIVRIAHYRKELSKRA